MMIWFKNLFGRSRTFRLTNQRPFALSLSEWQKNELLVSEAMKVATSPVFQAMLAVMRNESPSELVLPIGTQATDRIVLQSRIEGYHMALNNLEAMARLPEASNEQQEATFPPENAQDEDTEQ